MTAVAPSKRAKSQSAHDLRYGRRGGRALPLQSDAEQAEAFAAAVEAGAIVRAVCFCTYWWLVPMQLGDPCGHCGEPMVEEAVPPVE